LEDLFSSVFLQFKKYHPSGNLNFNNLSIFQSLKFCILMEKILPISLKLNFTPNTFGCYGLTLVVMEVIDAKIDKKAKSGNGGDSQARR